MGLDNIWHVPEGVEHPKLQVSLCGGMFSGPGKLTCTSFRGKVYAEFIQTVTGYSLYDDVLDKEDISSILHHLVEFKQELANTGLGYSRVAFLKDRFDHIMYEGSLEYGLNDLDDLITMFEAYSNIAGVELKSWY